MKQKKVIKNFISFYPFFLLKKNSDVVKKVDSWKMKLIF